MAIKVVLVAVSLYEDSFKNDYSCNDLPLCKNDLYAMQYALVNGLNIDFDNIDLLGEAGTVKTSTFSNKLKETIYNSTEEDILIFYFSGHGGDNSIACSDGLINLQSIIDTLNKTMAKNKIIILDSCYSGGFDLESNTTIKNIETFVGRGCAVMASCGATEKSHFNFEKKLSTYTSFLCDAILCKFISRKGKKSLEAINEALFRYIENWNRKNDDKIQKPIFRSNIGGTIFFDVEEYTPYNIENVYLETDKYIIYSVKSISSNVRRLAVKCILRYKYNEKELGDIVSEIIEKVRCCNVYSSQQEEARFKNQPAQIIWCYLGQDEEDIINSNYVYTTTWTSPSQNRTHWYNNADKIINDICFKFNKSYDMLKKMMRPVIDKTEFIKQAKDCTLKLVDIAEKYIVQFREFLNSVISETELIEAVKPLNKEITKLYFKHTNLPVPPTELHDWFRVHCKLAATIHDFSLYYNEDNLNVWSAENRKWLMTNCLKTYEQELEELKESNKNS